MKNDTLRTMKASSPSTFDTGYQTPSKRSWHYPPKQFSYSVFRCSNFDLGEVFLGVMYLWVVGIMYLCICRFILFVLFCCWGSIFRLCVWPAICSRFEVRFCVLKKYGLQFLQSPAAGT